MTHLAVMARKVKPDDVDPIAAAMAGELTTVHAVVDDWAWGEHLAGRGVDRREVARYRSRLVGEVIRSYITGESDRPPF